MKVHGEVHDFRPIEILRIGLRLIRNIRVVLGVLVMIGAFFVQMALLSDRNEGARRGARFSPDRDTAHRSSAHTEYSCGAGSIGDDRRVLRANGPAFRSE